MNTQRPFHIISAALPGDDAPGLLGRLGRRRDAAERTDTLRRQIAAQNLSTTEVRGAYNGQTEPALLVLDAQPDRGDTERTLLRLARQYGQESILAVDANRQATLVFTDGRRVFLGGFREVTAKQAARAPGYTERAGRYWVAGPLVHVANDG